MKKFALLMIIIFYSGCSRLDLVLNYAPRYITNEIDDALDLNSERFKNIKTVVTHDIDVNKKAIISEIIVKIEYLLMLTNNMELKYSEVQFSFNEFKDLKKKLVYLFKPSFSEVLISISKTEVDHLNAYVNEKLILANDRLADKKKYYKHYTKSYDHFMDLLFNSSNNEQDKLFRDFLDINYEYFKFQNEVKKTFRKQFYSLADKKNELLYFTMQLYASEDVIMSEEYIKKQDVFYSGTIDLICNIWKKSSVKQKLYFRNKLIDTKEELKKLIK